MRVGLLRNLAELGDDMFGRRQIGVAHPQVDDVPPRMAGCGAHVIHFGNDIGRQALDAVELVFHDLGFPAFRGGIAALPSLGS